MFNLIKVNKSLIELFCYLFTQGPYLILHIFATSHHYFAMNMGSCHWVGYVKYDVWANRKWQM